MIVHQAYRFALDPTVAQRRTLASHCGAARFAFNWGLAEVKRVLDARQVETQIHGAPITEPMSWTLPALRRMWNAQKSTMAPWWAENSKESYSSGLDALAHGLRAWSDSRGGRRAGQTVGFPRFRKRGHRASCRFTTGVIRVNDKGHVTLPRLGRLRTAEDTTALLERLTAGSARILSATVSREADRWFVSFTCEVDRAVVAGNGHTDTVGVDLGVLALATMSDGEIVRGPQPLRTSLRRLRRLQRTVSRRCTGSARRRRAVQCLARAHRRVSSVRRDHLHQLTTTLAKSHGCVVIEDLNVRGMSRSARGTVEEPGRNVRAKSGLTRGIADGSFGELRRMLEYKTAWYGSRLLVAPRFFPSSKRCSGCGEIDTELALGQRVYRCAPCGLEIQRDVNAARNLVWWAEHSVLGQEVAGSAPETVNARGADVSPEPARAVGDEAGTGDVPEPSGKTRGRVRRGLSSAASMRTAWQTPAPGSRRLSESAWRTR